MAVFLQVGLDLIVVLEILFEYTCNHGFSCILDSNIAHRLYTASNLLRQNIFCIHHTISEQANYLQINQNLPLYDLSIQYCEMGAHIILNYG